MVRLRQLPILLDDAETVEVRVGATQVWSNGEFSELALALDDVCLLDFRGSWLAQVHVAVRLEHQQVSHLFDLDLLFLGLHVLIAKRVNRAVERETQLS